MNCKRTVARLYEEIYSKLEPLIDSDYWLCEVPHYSNVGDTLIWQGELDFLKAIPFSRKGMSAHDSITRLSIRPGDLVLFQGGGNFGDLWKGHGPHEYRRRVMEANPTCRFIVFPQTVWYGHDENLKSDADFYSRYDCTICARDKQSYDTLKTNFKNRILLVPDMAFCMDMTRWSSGKFNAEKPFVLKRTDKEFCPSLELVATLSSLDADVDDWFPMTHRTIFDVWRDRILSRPRKLGWAYEPYMYYFYRPYLIRTGVRQLMSHTDIYTTRLHACILSILLDKENITFFDNTYGKNRNFYDAWLSDCDSVRMVR